MFMLSTAAHLSDAPQPAFTAAELAWFKKPISGPKSVSL